MDIQLKKKPWYFRYRYYLFTGMTITGLIIYAFILALGPKRLRIDAESLTIATVEDGNFMEYVEVEGIVHPIMTIKVNAQESGFVDSILAEEGSMLDAGDTILVLKNPELMRTIEDEQDEWERQQRLYREQEIEMQQKSLTLQQQVLDAKYEMSALDNKLRIAQEEYDMGMKSKAEIEMAESEYEYHHSKTDLQMQNLRHDSVATLLRRELLKDDIKRASTKRERAVSRKNGLYVLAPISGQLSYLNATLGQQFQAGSSVCELKILSDYKIHVTLNEFYIDRITSGLPANIILQQQRFPLKVSRVVPEIKDRNFQADLIFVGEKPSSVRVGKSFRVQIELGQPESAIVVPRGDFYGKTNGKWIYKLTPDRTQAIKAEISVGRQNPRQYEILSGLSNGDKVIISGYDILGDIDEIILK